MAQAETKITRVNRLLDSWIQEGREEAERFARSLEGNPLDILEWKGGLIESSARLTIAFELRSRLEAGADLPTILRYVEETIIQHARAPKRSTSPLSNLIAQTKLAVFAEFAQSASRF